MFVGLSPVVWLCCGVIANKLLLLYCWCLRPQRPSFPRIFTMTFADFVYGYFPHRHFWKKRGISTIVIVPDFHSWVPWSLMILSFLSVAFCRILRNVTLQKRKILTISYCSDFHVRKSLDVLFFMIHWSCTLDTTWFKRMIGTLFTFTT